MTAAHQYYISIGESLEQTENSQMFGKPCFKINKKAFVCFFEECMVFKLEGEAHADALSLDGAALFDPSKKGRPMKAWVQVPYHYKSDWKRFAIAARVFVKNI